MIAHQVNLTEAITTQFHVPTEYLRVCDKYYILYWSARYVYAQLLRSPRIVTGKQLKQGTLQQQLDKVNFVIQLVVRLL